MNKVATIFIVEDDGDLQKLYKIFLELFGLEVIGIASNGEEAVNMFKSFDEKPDIILMDHRMPIKNGLEATKEIIQIDKSAKILFVSADRSVKDKALSLGAINFECKPIKHQKLVNIIKKSL